MKSIRILLMSAFLVVGMVGLAACDADVETDENNEAVDVNDEALENEVNDAENAIENTASDIEGELDETGIEMEVNNAIESAGDGMDAVEVEMENGVLRLTGTVASEDLKMQAEDIARQTQGVTTIENNIQVMP